MSHKKSFEDALKRLNEIVVELETGDIILDDMTKLYEEGSELIKFCLDKLDDVEKKISRNTRAIIPMHYAGKAARDIEKLRDLAKKNKIILIEDNAESFGSILNGKFTGTSPKYIHAIIISN